MTEAASACRLEAMSLCRLRMRISISLEGDTAVLHGTGRWLKCLVPGRLPSTGSSPDFLLRQAPVPGAGHRPLLRHRQGDRLHRGHRSREPNVESPRTPDRAQPNPPPAGTGTAFGRHTRWILINANLRRRYRRAPRSPARPPTGHGFQYLTVHAQPGTQQPLGCIVHPPKHLSFSS
jgi:hypothetical protein